MKIGYARTSTVEQVAGLDAQVRELEKIGVDKVFRERVSSVAARDQLEAALEFAREGDVLVVTKLDRLARSIPDLVKITQRLEAKKVALEILAMNLDTSTPTGKLMMNVMGSVAQFEREMMLERQREGIAKAKADGKYVGRQPTARARTDEVLDLKRQGKTADQIAELAGVSRRSVFRILASHQV